MVSRMPRGTIAHVIAIAFGVALAPSAYADTASDNLDQLPEVLVTATKRVSTVQETSASITAVSQQDIADRGISDFKSLATSVPGISMRTSGPGQTEFEMRGLNSAGGNTSQVGFYLDETPLSSPASAQLGKEEIDPSLYDLSRVEVLRGPQGTLYGASSMGGTVNHKINGMVNLPIGDSLAVRLVGSEADDSGWIKRLVIQDGAVPADSGQ